AARFLPTFEVYAIEGAFGAGPGSSLDYDNRFDLGMRVGWNLTDLCTRNEKHRMADAQRAQAHYAYEDLLAKLAAGVQEARETILGGRDEMEFIKQQIADAENSRKRSKQRLDEKIPGATASEVMQSLGAVGTAEAARLNAIREYDKAQLRLMLLVGCRP